jgi:hypothetical protein
MQSTPGLLKAPGFIFIQPFWEPMKWKTGVKPLQSWFQAFAFKWVATLVWLLRRGMPTDKRADKEHEKEVRADAEVFKGHLEMQLRTLQRRLVATPGTRWGSAGWIKLTHSP